MKKRDIFLSTFSYNPVEVIAEYGIGIEFNQFCISQWLDEETVDQTLESFAESSDSMKSRGYSLKGRTAFSIYRFDNRGRSFVVVLFLCLTLITMAVMFNQTNIYYDPEIIMNRVTPVSVVFYAAYAVFLLLPMGLQMAGEMKYARLLSGAESALKY